MEKNNRAHKDSISFIIFIKGHIRGSMVRQSALFLGIKIEYWYVYICLVEGLLGVVSCVMSNDSSEF
jgi:hypothetical protein